MIDKIYATRIIPVWLYVEVQKLAHQILKLNHKQAVSLGTNAVWYDVQGEIVGLN